MLKLFCVVHTAVGRHKGKPLHGELKKIDATDARPLPSPVHRRAADAGSNRVCYAWVTMSAINGDKARFHRQRKHKLAKRERNRALRKKVAASSPRRPNGRDL